MKETYFTAATIDKVSQEMLAVLKPLIHPERCPFFPQKSALLVLDMQRQFLEPASHSFIPSAPAIIPGVNRLIAAFHQTGRPVIATRHVNSAADAGTMGRWWPRLITLEDPASELHPSVNRQNVRVVIKTRYDAFLDTPLQNMLIQADIRCVLVTGVMTHICCDTTARSAFQHGFDTCLAIDGTATYNRRFHECSLYTLAHACARPVLVQEIVEAFD